MKQELGPRLVAEYVGSMLLVVSILGPTILAHEIFEAGVPLSVYIAAFTTGGWLFVLVEILGPISGCHLNPAVTIPMMVTGDIDIKGGCLYIPVQIAGGLTGTLFSHMMFLHLIPTLWTISNIPRPAWCYWSEFLGTFALVSTVYGCIRRKSRFTGLAIGAVVAAGYYATSSTMFVNPQVVIARMFTYAIAGIRPLDVGPFVIAEVLGGLTAGGLFSYLYPKKNSQK